MEFLKWPGKSADPRSGISDPHPAVYHMLDVGAVADRLLVPAGFEEPQRQALVLLAALHDIGKIGNRFRAMIEKGETQRDRHWQVSMAWFAHFDDDVLGPLLGSREKRRFPLYAAAAGHHGGPPEMTDIHGGENRRRMVRDAGEAAARDAQAVIEGFAMLFPQAGLRDLQLTLKKANGDWRRSAHSLSWWLTGLISVADWVGSNTEWFPATAPDYSIDEYWQKARSQAQTALIESGLLFASPSSVDSHELFNFDAFTPMQRAVLECELPPKQTLAVIEDATGSGKTEAALMLAYRMMREGRGEGLFFALPTMATANAMYSRLAVMRHMFDGEPSLALAHSRAWLHQGFRTLIGRTESEPEEISCAEWFADGRRKALLANIGVGTIDQALLGVLPTRYFGLRLHALSRKILIVDEAHDYDPYMQAQLERLLTFHAMLGGSAILMTATLPQGTRRRFMKAFQEGGLRETEMTAGEGYPQLSIIGEDSAVQQVDPVADTCRKVEIERLAALDEALDVIADAAAKGAACAFVRNSVDEAIAAADALRERGIDAMLHHARFAMWDRLENENRVLAVFGKESRNCAGKVIVGTQVLEQSLDIDFDVMVSDLAPIGALIQRAGRLWRHMKTRPAATRPVPGPVLHVLSPDPAEVSDSDWSRSLLGKGWFVYPPTVQWRTAKALFAAGAITAPDGLRDLIEAVEGEGAPVVPAELEVAEIERLGEIGAERGQARQNLLDAFEDYSVAQEVWSDDVFPTRLGHEQVTLVLARRTADGPLIAYAPVEDGDAARAWALSEVSLSRARWEKSGGVDQTAPEIEKVRKDWKAWKQDRIVLCPVTAGIVSDSWHYDEAAGLFEAPHKRG